MLYSMILGNQNEISNNWSIVKNDFGSAFIANDAIHQRIKLGPNLMEKLEVEYTTPNVNAYNISDKIFFTNNYKNMNLVVRSFYNKDKQKVASHIDDSILYITLLNSNYKLLSYGAGEDVEIVQSYHQKNKLVGCAITFRDKIDDSKTVFTLSARDLKNNNFVNFEISVNNSHKVDIKKTVVSDETELAKLENLMKKFTKFFLGFKMDVRPGKFITRSYIVSEDKMNEFQPKISKIKDNLIIRVDGDEIEELDDDTKKAFLDAFGDSKDKAITVYGVKLPKNFCRELGLYYMFVYDDKENKLKCVQSN